MPLPTPSPRPSTISILPWLAALFVVVVTIVGLVLLYRSSRRRRVIGSLPPIDDFLTAYLPTSNRNDTAGWLSLPVRPLTPAERQNVTVLLAVNENAAYADLVPTVSAAWQQFIGFHVQVVHITPQQDLVPGIPTAQQAQIARVLLPALQPNRLFLMSDADMLPLSRNFFHRVVQWYLDSRAAQQAKAEAAAGQALPPVPMIGNPQRAAKNGTNSMCYYIGDGASFRAVTGVKNRQDVARVMRSWYDQGYGWSTDEQCFGRALLNAAAERPVPRCYKLFGSNAMSKFSRLDRAAWPPTAKDMDKIDLTPFIDGHLPHHSHQPRHWTNAALHALFTRLKLPLPPKLAE